MCLELIIICLKFFLGKIRIRVLRGTRFGLVYRFCGLGMCRVKVRRVKGNKD